MSDGKAKSPRTTKARGKAVGNAAVAFLSLTIALGVGWWIAVQADILGVRFDRAYFVLLVVLGLSAAVFLFGVMRSSAEVTGSHLGTNFQVGGPAALFLIVIGSGFWLTKEPDSFEAMVRLQYAGPPVNRGDYEAALSQSQLRVYYGLNTRDFSVSNLGEVLIRDIPGRFRTGAFRVEMIAGQIRLLDHTPDVELKFPGTDQTIALKAALAETPRRASERDGLRQVLASAQQTLLQVETRLLPAIDAFLADPQDTKWNHVRQLTEQILGGVENGIELAIRYEAEYGGLMGRPQEVAVVVDNARQRIPLPRTGVIPTPRTGGLIPSWNTRGRVLRDVPLQPDQREQVLKWRAALHAASQRVYDQLNVLVERLSDPVG